MKQSLFLLLASVGLTASASASQVQTHQGTLHRTVAPIQGSYNMTTGFELGASAYRSGPETIFDNTDGLNYYFATMPGTHEWIDSMAFVNDEISGFEQINGWDFQYCSLLVDPVGDAITVEVRFYDDNPGGQEPTGWTNPSRGTVQNATCAYGLSGLPGNTTAIGGGSCWSISIDLMCGYECPIPQETTPGGFTQFNGLGWVYYDAGGTGLTGPFIGSTVTAAGPGTAIPGYGSKDELELMDLTIVGAPYSGTFNFGGGPKAQATMNVVLYGDGIPDTDVMYAWIPDIRDVLCLGSDIEFRTGNAVTWALDDRGGTAIFPSSIYALVTGTRGNPSGFGDRAGRWTTLLVNPRFFQAPPTTLVMSGAVPSVTSPPLPGLPPTVWVQAFGFNGGIGIGNAAEASNALRHNN